MKPIIKIENVSKQYRLGLTGTGTFSHDVNRWWHSIRGKEDPYLKIGETNDRSTKGESDYVWALRDINFEVMPGEVLGIIGKNGAGKSTLLKLLSRVTAPTTGSIKARGRIASLLEVGTGFHPELTGRENVFLNGAIMGMTKPEIRSKFDEIVDFAGCERYIDTPVKRYSSGMYVRLAFAVAAHLEPDILVVDEVLAVGDAEFQKKAIGKMKDVSNESGRTVLFVSHNMAAVQNLCKNTIWLKNGTFRESGKTSLIIHNYLNEYNAQEFVPIKDRKDRKGNGVVLIEDLKIIDKKTNLEIIDSYSGQSLLFRIYYKSNNYQFDRIKSIHIGIPFLDGNEKFITTLNNKLIGVEYSNMPLKGYVECIVDKIPFMSGDYNLGINLIVDDILSDSIYHCLVLSIKPSNFYHNEKFRLSVEGGIYLNQEWKLK